MSADGRSVSDLSEQFDVNITRIGTKLLTCTGDLLLQRGLNVTASVQTGTARSSVGFRTAQLNVGSAAAAAVNGFVTTGSGVVQTGAVINSGSATVTGVLQAGTISTASLSAGTGYIHLICLHVAHRRAVRAFSVRVRGLWIDRHSECDAAERKWCDFHCTCDGLIRFHRFVGRFNGRK